jgi:hypothetical protein
MLSVHSSTWGRMYTKNASDDQRPSIMILWTEWSVRKRDIAAPDRRDFVPMSLALNPKVFSPPSKEQVDRMNRRSASLVMKLVRVARNTELIGESRLVLGTRRCMRSMRDASLRTGHSTVSVVR